MTSRYSVKVPIDVLHERSISVPDGIVRDSNADLILADLTVVLPVPPNLEPAL